MNCKLKLIFVLFILLTIAGGDVYGQVDIGQKLTIPTKEMSFRTCLKVLSRMAKVDFAYNSANIPLDQRLVLAADNQSLDSVLKAIGYKLKLDFKVIGKTILIDKQKESGWPKEQQISYKTFDDPLNKRFIVTGIVLDGETGLPLEGVVVSLNRDNIAVKTDRVGKFTIYLPYQ